MAWKVEFVLERSLVTVTASGVIQNEDAKAQAAEVVRLLRRHESGLLLLDYAEAFSELSLPELYWLADQAMMLGTPWRLRIAVVLPSTRYRIGSYEFFELVFRNAGFEVRLFEGRDAALAWVAPWHEAPTSARQHVHA